MSILENTRLTPVNVYTTVYNMTNSKIDREEVAAKIAELVALANDSESGVSIPRRLGFLLGELQGMEIMLRHGDLCVPGARERFDRVRATPEVR